MTLGKGAVSSYLQKIKLNTRSSTETELVAVDAYMPEMLWSLYFIQGQGYGVEFVELHQDNISAQMLEVNGRFSSSKKTKHIKAKFFFIKDKVDQGEIKVKDCPTEVMWADILTKPLQGKGFRVQRARLMNCAEDYSETEEEPTEKRVSWGKSVGTKVGKTAGGKATVKSWPRAMSGRRPSTGLTQTLQECVWRDSSGLTRDSKWQGGSPRHHATHGRV